MGNVWHTACRTAHHYQTSLSFNIHTLMSEISLHVAALEFPSFGIKWPRPNDEKTAPDQNVCEQECPHIFCHIVYFLFT